MFTMLIANVLVPLPMSKYVRVVIACAIIFYYRHCPDTGSTAHISLYDSY